MGFDAFNEALDGITEENQQRDLKPVIALTNAYGLNPDDEAKKRTLERQTGIPAPLMSDVETRQSAERQAFITDKSVALIPRGTANFFSNPENAAVAHDDVQNLSDVENIIKNGFGKVGGSTMGIASKRDQQTATRAKSIGGAFVEGLSASPELFSQGLARTGQMAVEALNWSLKGFADETGMRQSVADTVRASADYWKALADAKMTDRKPGAAESYFQQAGSSVGTSLMAAPFAIGGQGAALTMFAVGADGGYQEMRDKGVSVPAAVALAGSNQAMEGLTEKLGLDAIFKGTGPILKKAMGFVLGDLAGEEVNTLYSALVDKVTIKADMTMGDVVQQVVDTAIVTGIAGGAQGITHASAANVSSTLYDSYIKKERAQQNANFLQSLGSTVQASKLRGRLPEKMREAVDGFVAEHGTIESVSIPVEYWQSELTAAGLDPRQIAEQVMSDPAPYFEALASGGEVVIPLADYALNIAPEEIGKLLEKDTRLRMGDDTLREAEGVDHSEMVNGLLNEANEPTDEAATDQVYSDIYGQLIGVRPAAVAEQEARLAAARNQVRAQRLGLDPLALYQQNPLKISSQLPDGLGELWQSPQSREGSETLSVRKTQAEGMLLTAVIQNGTAKVAGVGATHYEVHSEKSVQLPEGAADANGFVTPDGQFLDRKQALVWLKANRPDVYKALDKVTRANGLESQAYAYAEGMGGDTSSLADSFMKRQFGSSAIFSQGTGAKRGFFRPSSREIGILENADRSTFIHELSHSWLEELKIDASRPDASDQLKQDWETIREWAKIEGDTISVEAHEQFARGGESYIMEGNAPSDALRAVFGRFKNWLTRIYRELKNLNVNLTPEVRGVFDRLLASDEEIANAETEQELRPIFVTAEDAGMSAAMFTAYQKTAAEAGQRRREVMERKLLKEIEREETKWWKDEKASVRAEVESEAKQEPAHSAIQILTKRVTFSGQEMPLKLDRAALVEKYGEAILKRLPKGSATEYVYAAEGGLHPDVAAEMLGFVSGDEMVRQILEAPNLKRFIVAEADRLMKERHGDLVGNIAERADEALKAVHEDATGEVLREEMRAIRRKAREVKGFIQGAEAEAKAKLDREKAERDYERRWMEAEKNLALAVERGAKEEEIRQLTEAAKTAKAEDRTARREMQEAIPSIDAFKQAAAAAMRDKKIGLIDPAQYARAERTAAKEAFTLLAKKDYAKAGEAKRRQLLNFYLYREAVKIKEDVDKALKGFEKAFGNDEKMAKTRNIDLVNAARAILGSYGIGPSTDNPLAFLHQVQQYNPTLYEDLQMAVDVAIQDAQPYKRLTAEEFFAVKDAVDNLMHLAKREKTVEIDGRLIPIDVAIGELTAALTNEGLRPQGSKYATKNKMEQVSLKFAGAVSAGKRVEHWVDARDMGDINGPFRKYFWNPVSEAASNYRLEKAAYLVKFRELFKPVEGSLQSGDISAPELGVAGATFRSKAELLMAVLHTGNNSNKEKLLVGRGWGFIAEDGGLDTSAWDAFVSRMWTEGTLTEADYLFAQDVWNLLEELKPQAQQAHRQMYGYYFSEITADPVFTPWGAFAGGYVPAVTDPYQVQDQATREDREALLNENQTSMFPTPSKGFTKKRVDYNKKLSLDMHLLSSHIDKVLKFVHLAPPVRDVAKILTTHDFADVLEQFDPTAREILAPWLMRAVRQTAETRSSGWGGKFLDDLARGLRNRTGLQLMALNVANTIQQFTGLSISLSKVKAGYLKGGLWHYVKAPGEASALVAERSAFMRDRMSGATFALQGDINLLLDDSKLGKVQEFSHHHGYVLQQMTQNIVDVATWLGRYNQSVAEGADEKTALRAADSAVRETQGSFAPEDVSRLEGGSPFVRMFTQFYSYFNMQANLLGSQFHNITREFGFRGGSGRLFMLYVTGFMIPAVLSQAIIQIMSGRPLDEDDDGEVWDDLLMSFFGSQAKTGAAMVPLVGQVAVSTANRFNKNPNDDRISASPVVSSLEAIGGTAHAAYVLAVDGEIKRQGVKDSLTVLGLFTSLPFGALGRPLGYLTALERGDTEPANALDATRGFITGYAPKN